MRKYYRLNNSTGLSKEQLLLHTISEFSDLTTPNRPAVSTVPHESTIFLAILLAITACMMVILGFLTFRVFQRYWVIREEERFIEEAHAAIVQADLEAAVPISEPITWTPIRQPRRLSEPNR
ncbi:Hypothetical predicted protein [Octopus vulgaris]|uniref:Uncharacterized protein n=2 Tax=Octopus TaxID=6643 RepID=A0AA36AG59_OCTVU|nr:uncharacterized protein LOC115223826 [Octopus sinensis]CAI9715501.1 Hypothetical predicted protein [Octopus vulgaris]